MPVATIGIESPIAGGKTTFCRKVAERLNGLVIEEPVEDNPYLLGFYDELQKNEPKLPMGLMPPLWHLPFVMQIYLLHRRYTSFQAAAHLALQRGGDDGPIFLDRTIWFDEVFARMLHESGHISDEQWSCYLYCLSVMSIGLCFPSHIIYLYVTPETAYRRLNERSRDGETVSLNYLQQLHDGYERRWSEMERGLIPGARGSRLERVNWNLDVPVGDEDTWRSTSEMVRAILSSGS
uniref:Putative NADH dehydrogenase n=1 Tax=viral metagenome TaxID=1070528 RepID=A0A6H2A0S4_9ZZZZ